MHPILRWVVARTLGIVRCDGCGEWGYQPYHRSMPIVWDHVWCHDCYMLGWYSGDLY